MEGSRLQVGIAGEGRECVLYRSVTPTTPPTPPSKPTFAATGVTSLAGGGDISLAEEISIVVRRASGPSTSSFPGSSLQAQWFTAGTSQQESKKRHAVRPDAVKICAAKKEAHGNLRRLLLTPECYESAPG